MKTIELTQGQYALVDDELFDELNRYKWRYGKRLNTVSVMRHVLSDDGTKTTRYMHQDVYRLLGEDVPPFVDHTDTNGLNNQRHNLRASTSSGQSHRFRQRNNTAGHRGVSWNKRRGKYRAYAKVDRKQFDLGFFDDAFSAAWARDRFVRLRHGEFAALNNLTDRRKQQMAVAIERRKSS